MGTTSRTYGWLLAGSILIALPAGLGAISADQGAANGVVPGTQPASTQPVKSKEEQKAENASRVLEFFRINQPYLYEPLKVLQKTDPSGFDHQVAMAINNVKRLEDLRKKNKPLFEMKMQDLELSYETIELGKQIRGTDINAADKDSLTKQLTDKLNQQFDLGQKIRQAQIDDLRRQLADCEKKLQDRANEKDDRIKKRLDDLLQTTPSNNW